MAIIVSVLPEEVKVKPPMSKLRLLVALKIVTPPSSVLNVAEPAPESTPQENLPVEEFQSKVSDSVLQFVVMAEKAEPKNAEAEALPITSKLVETEAWSKVRAKAPPVMVVLVSRVIALTNSSKSRELEETPPEPQENFLLVSSHLRDWVVESQSVSPAPANWLTEAMPTTSKAVSG